MTKRILLLLTATAVMVLMLASAALADSHGGRQSGGQSMPRTGGPALLLIGGAALGAGVGISAGVAYLRRRGR